MIQKKEIATERAIDNQAMQQTEMAVGLAFDGKSTPTVSVTGKGELSNLIKNRAQRYGVPVRKDSKLVRKLENLSAEEEIPLDCYQEVAELLISIDND